MSHLPTYHLMLSVDFFLIFFSQDKQDRHFESEGQGLLSTISFEDENES